MEITDKGPPITMSELKPIEQRLGARLPLDYRDFLSKYNGGTPSPRTFLVATHSEEAFDIQILFGLSRQIDTENLSWYIAEYQEFVEEGLLPIGGTDTSDLLLLSVGKEGSRGTMYFWDSMAEDQSDALHHVSANFSEFLEKLVDLPYR